MQKKRLGNTDLDISVIGCGTWAIGGGNWDYGWGSQDDKDSIAAIRQAVASGINWIDTAAVYGLGHSEEVVARALEDMDRSERPYLFTKCSLTWNAKGHISHSLKADSLKQEVEDSLRRLRIEAIYLYQIHWPSQSPSGPAPDLEEGWSTLVELQRAGKVRYIGVSNFDEKQLERAGAIAPVSSLQPPYSMLMRDIEGKTLPYCQFNNIGVLAYSPMHSGLLSGAMTRERIAVLPANDWRAKKSTQFREPALTRNLQLVELLRNIGSYHGRSPGEVAIAWVLVHPTVTGAIVGFRRPEQVDGVIGAGEFRLTESEAAEIDDQLPPSSPRP